MVLIAVNSGYGQIPGQISHDLPSNYPWRSCVWQNEQAKAQGLRPSPSASKMSGRMRP